MNLKFESDQIEPDSNKSGSNIRTQPDVRSIMAQIRDQVRTSVGNAKDSKLPFTPANADLNGADRKAGEILNSEELRYLNQNHVYPITSLRPETISSHRPIVGKFIVKLKRKILTLLWDGLFRPYFQAEKEYQSNLVRLLNDFAKYVDQRDGFIFWELIEKIDYDINKALTRIEQIGDEQSAARLITEREIYKTINSGLNQITTLDTHTRGIEARIEVLESVSRGLERVVTKITSGDNKIDTPPQSEESPSSSPQHSPQVTPIDYSYLLLENRYRGSEQAISERLSYYPKFFKESKEPVLEIGCGRGELQQLFKDAGVPSYGIEMDPAMAQACADKGFKVLSGDGIAHLEGVKDGSLGGVIAIQVIEHLTQEQLRKLVSLCLKKVRSGGKVIFETINTESMVALARNYFRDPTHVFPLHPETMRFILELMGLKVVSVNKLSPYSEEATLKEIEVTEFMSPRWAVTIETLNRNIRRLNELLYGHQDYCIVAEV